MCHQRWALHDVIKQKVFMHLFMINSNLPLTFYLAPFPSYGRLLVKFLLVTGVPHFNSLAGGDPLRISP